MKRNETIGILAGIASGAAYGLNPVFAKPLLAKGVSVSSMLLVRYVLAMLITGAILLISEAAKGHKSPLSVRRDQLPRLLMLGFLFTISSIALFEAYKFIPSGMAATIVYLYPIFTALTMIFYNEYPSVKTIVAIVGAFCGVALMCLPSAGSGAAGIGDAGRHIPDPRGLGLAAVSALSYALYLVGIGKSRKVADLGVQTITVYALAVGSLMLLAMHFLENGGLLSSFGEGRGLLYGVSGVGDWLRLLGLAVFPTAIAMVGLSVSTRRIGATRAAILGVFEPLTSITFGILMFQEPFSLTTALGMAVCLLAVCFIRS